MNTAAKSGWETGTYSGLREAELDDALAATADQRLEVLQSMMEFAAEAEVATRRADELDARLEAGILLLMSRHNVAAHELGPDSALKLLCQGGLFSAREARSEVVQWNLRQVLERLADSTPLKGSSGRVDDTKTPSRSRTT